MKDKEMIEEMAKIIEYAINNECKLNNGKSCEDCEFDNKGDWHCQSLMTATHLYGERYRKLPEDSVVIPKEISCYENIEKRVRTFSFDGVNKVDFSQEQIMALTEMFSFKEKNENEIRKETAEKIICVIKTFSYDKEFTKIITRIIAERFGVEIKE